MSENENWAESENAEVDEAVDNFHAAQQAQHLRETMREYAKLAVTSGNVDRDWVNERLHRLGIEPITVTADYRIAIPVTGNYATTVRARSRAEALERFHKYVQETVERGEVSFGSHGQAVTDLQLQEDVATFLSGPQDPPTDMAPQVPLAALRAGIRDMLMKGVSGHGWGHAYAIKAITQMGLKPLPELVHRTATVPVSGTAQISVCLFKGDGDDELSEAATAVMSRSGQVSITPEEVGMVYAPRGSSDPVFTLVDDDD